MLTVSKTYHMAARGVSLWEAAPCIRRACSTHEPPYSDRFS